jgi:hypothetical protein
MNEAIRWFGAAGLGAGLMYFLDPDRGRRRRAEARNQGTGLWNRSSWFAGKAWRDASNRAHGAAAAGRRLMGRGADEPGPQVVEARVRSALGRATSHPGAVDVSVIDGCAHLTGAVLEHEHEGLISAVRSVRSVSEVEDRLERHPTAEGISSLQGGGPAPRRRSEWAQENWTPALRAVAAGAGCGILGWSLASRTAPSALAGLAGVALLGRAVWNKPIKQMAGGNGRHGMAA